MTTVELVLGAMNVLLTAWLARVESRTALLHRLDVDVAVLKNRGDGFERKITEVETKIDDIREHMLRREDLEILRGTNHS